MFQIKNKINNPKQKIPHTEKSGIYQISCEDCNAIYIGQTKRKISIRFKEHISYSRLKQKEKSKLAEHLITKNHSTTINNLKLIKTVENKNLDSSESLYIKKVKNKKPELVLNGDEGPISSYLFKFCLE